MKNRSVLQSERADQLASRQEPVSRALPESAQLAAMLSAVGEGCCALDDRGHFTFINAAAERMLGLVSAALLGRELRELFPDVAFHLQHKPCDTPRAFEHFDAGQNRWLSLKLSRLTRGWFLQVHEQGLKEPSATDFREVQQRLETQVEDLRRLHTLSLRLATPLALNAILREILRTAMAVHGTEMGMLSLYDNERDGLKAGESSGFPTEVLKLIDFVPAGSGGCGLCCQRRIRVAIEDTETDPAFATYRQLARNVGFRAVHSTPLITSSDRLIGVLSVHFKAPRTPTDRETRLMDMLARQAADSIETARLRERAEREAAERLKAQEALRMSEERFRLAAHTEALTLYEQDANLRYVWLYPSHPEHAGAIGRTDLDLLPKNEGEALMRLKQEVLDTGSARRIEVQTSLASGVCHYDIFISPRRNQRGDIVGVSGVALDITGSKRTEMQQRALYELVATVNGTSEVKLVFEAALDAICRCHNTERASILLYDERGMMRFRAWRALSDAYRGAVEGHSPWAPDESDPQVAWVNNIADSNLDPHLRRVVIGEGIRALAFIPIACEKRLFGMFAIYYDSSHFFTQEELRPAQAIATQVAFALHRQKSGEALERLVDERTASLREAIAQMEEFSYSVSHDLRAPVRAMQGYARALLEDFGVQLNAMGREYLERIVRSGARMDRLIQDILIYSRLSRREICLQPVSLGKLFREILSQYPEMQSPYADIELVEPFPDVLAHEPSLSQAISNLLSNAVKFVAPGVVPKIRIAAERRAEQVRFWIEDNGIGIHPEHQHRLFGMFERIHPEQKYEGTGIGLAIVRKAVERMGGKVGVQSDGKSGSRFWLELSVATPPRA